jgi:hypothetical protein
MLTSRTSRDNVKFLNSHHEIDQNETAICGVDIRIFLLKTKIRQSLRDGHFSHIFTSRLNGCGNSETWGNSGKPHCAAEKERRENVIRRPLEGAAGGVRRRQSM